MEQRDFSRKNLRLDPSPRIANSSCAVLIVADSRTARKVLSKAVEGSGYNPRIVDDEADFIATVKSQHPDIMLLADWCQRDDVIGRIDLLLSDSETCGIPVIVSTSSTAHADITKLIDAGATDCIALQKNCIATIATIRARLRLCWRVNSRIREMRIQQSKNGQRASTSGVESGYAPHFQLVDTVKNHMQQLIDSELRMPLSHIAKLSSPNGQTREIASRSELVETLGSCINVFRRFCAVANGPELDHVVSQSKSPGLAQR